MLLTMFLFLPIPATTTTTATTPTTSATTTTTGIHCLVASIREAYGNEGINFENFMTTENPKQDLTMIKNILKFYEDL